MTVTQCTTEQKLYKTRYYITKLSLYLFDEHTPHCVLGLGKFPAQ